MRGQQEETDFLFPLSSGPLLAWNHWDILQIDRFGIEKFLHGLFRIVDFFQQQPVCFGTDPHRVLIHGRDRINIADPRQIAETDHGDFSFPIHFFSFMLTIMRKISSSEQVTIAVNPGYLRQIRLISSVSLMTPLRQPDRNSRGEQPVTALNFRAK